MILLLGGTSVSLAACGDGAETTPPPVEDSGEVQEDIEIEGEGTEEETEEGTETEGGQQWFGLVKDLQSGDLMCYATLENDSGEEFYRGASFEICEQSETYLNKTVRLSYEVVNINDCESIEPCGKTRQEEIITGMEIIP